MISSRVIQILLGAVILLFLFTNFVSLPHGDLSGGNPRPTTSFEGFRYRITSRIRPFFGNGESWLSERLIRSERIYQHLISQRDVLAGDYIPGEEQKLFPADSVNAYWKTPFSIWDFAPAAFNCPHTVQRLGRLGDGGKWLCGIEKYAEIPAEQDTGNKSACVIYSFGIQTESSFEEEVLQRAGGCAIWGYDFSVSKFGHQLRSAQADGRAHFLQAGIAGTTDTSKDPPYYSIQDLMRNNGHHHIDILKMDIEGYEFETMKSVVEAFANSTAGEIPISQFLVEIHLDPGRIKDAIEFMDWWTMLEDAGFRPVWTEPNLLVTTVPIHDGKPRYAEYTFINIKDSKSVLLK